jgi:hypothetical protein
MTLPPTIEEIHNQNNEQDIIERYRDRMVKFIDIKNTRINLEKNKFE